jgi:hypothetical protein
VRLKNHIRAKSTALIFSARPPVTLRSAVLDFQRSAGEQAFV